MTSILSGCEKIFLQNDAEADRTEVHLLLGALKVCSRTRNLERGKLVHADAIARGHDSNTYVANALINMYAKCGSMVDARKVFEGKKHPTVVSWTALILGYVDIGQGQTALDMFSRMRTEGSKPDFVTLVAALKACTSLSVIDGASQSADKGKTIHNLVVENGCDSEVYVQSTLVDMYSKQRSMADARQVFDSMKHSTVVSWTALILGYANNGQGETALDLFLRMITEGLAPDSVTLVAALKACISIAVKEGDRQGECKDRGKEIHKLAVKGGFDSDVIVQSILVDMYGKCGSMVDAREVFDIIKNPTLVSWTTLILGYTDNGQERTALDIFIKMRTEGPEPDSVTLLAALKACTSLAVKGVDQAECRDRGKGLHNIAIENGCSSDVYVQNSLIDLYVKCGCMGEAHGVFENMEHPTVVSWNGLILGYADNGEGQTAITLFTMMRTEGPAFDPVTLIAVLKACISLAVKGASEWALCREMGKTIHNIGVENGCILDVYLRNFLMDVYAKCGSMVDARLVFDGIHHPNVVSWTVLIMGYADNGQCHNALHMFTRMTTEGTDPDSITLVAPLKAYISLAMKKGKGASQCAEFWEGGKMIHNIAVQNGCDSDVCVQSTLVDMYAKCGSMADAREVFDSMKYTTVMSWTVLIWGYVDNDQGQTALDMLARMISEGHTPDSVTLVAALKACTSLVRGFSDSADCRDSCKKIQTIAVENGCSLDVYVQSTLVDMYAKCGYMVDAREIFDSMKHPTVVSWTALILGYADNGQGHAALDLFNEMRIAGPVPDSVTFGATLKACGLVGALEFGRTIHLELDGGNISDVVIVNCLVDFYAKCGSLIEAQRVFDLHGQKRDMVTWNALIAGFSSCGDNEAVFGLFEAMHDTCFQPDGITFLCVLTCCSHAGLVVKGKQWFDAMSREYGVIPTVKHYTCMIDLFGRSNKLDDAMALLESMPCSPNQVTYTTILGACRKWKNVEIGKLAFQSLIDLDEKDATAYLLMGQIYGSKGMLQEQEKVIGLSKKLKPDKKPGQTCWTNEAGHVHMFMAKNNQHPQIQEIHHKCKSMSLLLYTEKEDEHCGHSERLALACALINTNSTKPIRIVKNMKVCDDCHTVIASISKMESRTIICRDTSRIHVFQNGKCSCGDLW